MQPQPPGNTEQIGFEGIFLSEFIQILKDNQHSFACQVPGILAVAGQTATITLERLVTRSVHLHEHLLFGWNQLRLLVTER
jgi:hypothetical protein